MNTQITCKKKISHFIRLYLTGAAIAIFVFGTGNANAQNLVTNGTFNTNLTGWTVSAGWSWRTEGFVGNDLDNSTSTTLSQTLSSVPANGNILSFSVSFNASGLGSSSATRLEVSYNSIVYATMTTTGTTASATINAVNGAVGNATSVPEVSGAIIFAQFKLTLPNGMSSSAPLTFRQIAASSTSDDLFIDNVALSKSLPGGVPGSSMWVRADKDVRSAALVDITTIGGTIGNWVNQMNSANNYITGSGTVTQNATTNLWNFNPTAQITSTGSWLNSQLSAYGANGMAYTKYAAFNQATSGFAGRGYIESTISGTGNTNWYTETAVAGRLGIEHQSQAGFVYSNVAFGTAINKFLIGAARFVPSLPSSVYINGISGPKVTSTANSNTYSSQASTLGAFANGNSAVSGSPGVIPEFIQFPMANTDLEVRQVESYLAIKYGQTLSNDNNGNTNVNETLTGLIEGDYIASDGTTKTWNGSANTLFHNNIAGIGRDGVTAMLQKQSQSINTGSQVTVALGTIFTTNQLNTGTITADKQFLVWGDNAATGNTVIAHNGMTARLSRTWAQQNSNSFSQSVTVYYPTSALSFFVSPKLIFAATAAGLTSGTGVTIVTANAGTTLIGTVVNTGFTVTYPTTGTLFFSFAGAATFPGGVTGTRLWYKANAGVTTATGASQWNNFGSTGTEHDVKQATAAAQPLYNTTTNLFNYNPTLAFDGIDNSLGVTGATTDLTSPSNSVFTVVKQNSIANSQDYLSFTSLTTLNQGLQFRITDNNTFGYDFGKNTGGGYLTNGTTFAARTANQVIADVIYDHAGPSATFNKDGNTFHTGTNSLTQPSTLKTLAIGALNNGGTVGYFLNANMGEEIEYAQALTPVDRLRVQSYLGIKYGHTLSKDNNGNSTSNQLLTGFNEGDYMASNGTTKTWDGIANATYHNNIAGIGRDDITALLQKQSRSINAVTAQDDMVLMATNAIATTNIANAGTIATDLSFNVWGDNNASATTTTNTNLPTEAGPTCALRLPRQWKLQRTGTGISNVQVQLDLTGTGFANLNTLTAADFDLMIDRDGNGIFTDGLIHAVAATSYSNTTPFLVTFDGVNWDSDLNGSDVFTIVLNKSSFTPPAILVASGSSLLSPTATCPTSDAYIQFVNNNATPTEKYMAIKPNGNTGYNFGSGITAMNNLPTINSKTMTTGASGSAYATTLANRMYQATTTGTFTVNGGMVVRIYYQQSDLDNANTAAINAAKVIDAAAIDKVGKWFKYDGSFTDIIANQTGNYQGFNTAKAFNFFTDPEYGTENGVNYVEFSGIQSFSSFGYMAAAGSPSTFILPIKLSSFTGTSSNCKGLLAWVTSAEQNSSRYEVESSTDGLAYSRVGTVASKNSATGSSYRFTYNDLAPGNNILRLKIVDIDGSFEYSPNVVINNTCSRKVAIKVSPNPTTSVITVSGLSGTSRIQLINAKGQKLTYVVTMNRVKEINLASFAKGVYIIQVIADNGTITNMSVVKL